MIQPFEKLGPEYEKWVANCRPRPEKVSVIDSVARRLTRSESLTNFALVHKNLGIPELITIPSFERECGCNFACSPAQGDRWDHVSVHVPKGRGPFKSWYDAAYDTYHNLDRLDVHSAPFSMAYACYWWEKINGFGYRAHGLRSPYIVGGTNLQQPGKYVADGEFDSSVMDSQLGCLPIAMRMLELHPELSMGDALNVVSLPIVQAPPVQPVPAAFGGTLTGARWVQASLNVVLHLNPPLKVDGSYGVKTNAAVRLFRERYGLPSSATDRVDDAFCTALTNNLAVFQPVS